MAGRHRKPESGPIVHRRLGAAGVAGLAGLAAAFATSPAHADPTPAPTDSSSVPGPTPSGAPSSSPDPSPSDSTSTTPPSSTPPSTTPPSDDPSGSVPPSPAPSASSNAPAPISSVTPGPKQPKRVKSAADPLQADFGAQKIRVGVQIKSGAYVPDGTTTAGTTVTIVETGDGVPDGSLTTTCQTEASTILPGSTESFCEFDGDEDYVAAPGDSVTITQTTVNADLVIDSTPQNFGPCEPVIIPIPPYDSCLPESATFTDDGVPPDAADDTATTVAGQSVDIDVLANDETNGAPTTIESVTQPAHGTVEIVPASDAPGARRAAAQPAATSSATLRYTPSAGFIGTDPFTYTISTANGTSTATVSVAVTAPPPTAVDDQASVQSGKSVTIDVLDNDDANGGGALSIASVGTPHHGTVTSDGDALVYTSDADFTGTDTFAYTAQTAGGTDTAEVTITITAPPSTAPSSATSTPPLADTGTDVEQGLDIATVLLLAGGAATVAGSRRRRGKHAG